MCRFRIVNHFFAKSFNFTRPEFKTFSVNAKLFGEKLREVSSANNLAMIIYIFYIDQEQ